MVWGSPNDSTSIPWVDPGEPFADMAQQFLGLGSVPSSKVNPYPGSGPLVPGTLGLNGGYLANYAPIAGSNEPAADIMHCYVPELMPVSAYLARNFMVCDQWFASAPTHTFTNRMFASCAAPGGGKTLFTRKPESFLDDPQYAIGIVEGGLDLPSIFQLLDEANPASGSANWKLYFHDYTIIGLLLQYVRAQFDNPENINLAYFSGLDYPAGWPFHPLKTNPPTFFEDLAAGTLPPFSLIEPRYSNNYPGMAPGLQPNSNHPGMSDVLSPIPDPGDAPIDVVNGELLLADVYLALRTSNYWEKTLLLITYDEPGGTYDHVAPVPMTPPGPTVVPASNGFSFNWSGGRVPAIVVSPYVTAGSRLVAPAGKTFDHTSIIATVRDAFPNNMGGPINDRDAAAPSILPPLGTTASNHPDPAEVQNLVKQIGDVE
jgi:phospholipase C